LAVEIDRLAAQHAAAEVCVITAGDQTEPHRNCVVSVPALPFAFTAMRWSNP
jgi:hypothetical protein